VEKKKCQYAFPWLALTREPVQGVWGIGASGVQGRNPLVRGQRVRRRSRPEAYDISASLDYIFKVNLTPEFLIMGPYFNLSGVP